MGDGHGKRDVPSESRGAGLSLPSASLIAAAGAVGFLGYGVSLVLFVIALRDLGTARTGAYFSVAPGALQRVSALLGTNDCA